MFRRLVAQAAAGSMLRASYDQNGMTRVGHDPFWVVCSSPLTCVPPPTQLSCLNAFGGTIPTAPRRVIGRCVLVNGTAYSLTASSPEERWEEVGPLLRAVVATFRK